MKPHAAQKMSWNRLETALRREQLFPRTTISSSNKLRLYLQRRDTGVKGAVEVPIRFDDIRSVFSRTDKQMPGT